MEPEVLERINKLEAMLKEHKRYIGDQTEYIRKQNLMIEDKNKEIERLEDRLTQALILVGIREKK